ncbi:hypothetical protein QBC47DRAFT_387388 [Echria macrotheca]|uniref:UBX domain-containing protein 1 n=1 Tax=Echria macrotheca TaxID=438768 RepID=A0AAJ0BA15_9PEZI|nr:hypothetical protein QBC47DRAFT_387388 [Echria macrotheca]
MADRDNIILNFRDITGTSLEEALEYLEASHWNPEAATEAFFADMDESHENQLAQNTQAPAEPEYTGPRTLDGRPAPQAAGSSSSAKKSQKPPKRTGLATLSSLGGNHSHDEDDGDDEDDDEDDRRGPRDLFAGGEKSGLAVQDPGQRSNDPRRLINDIVAKAKADAKKHQSEQATRASRFFGGGGQTLGGDGVESRRVGQPPQQPIPTAEETPAVERILHIWTDGFSIDDGPLHRFDDPQNQADLNMIRQGRAPLHLMNVRIEQRVDVKLMQHQEKYKQLPKVYRPFGGEGRRLGSPVPGVEAVAAPPVAVSATTPATPSGPATGVDNSQPTLMLRIQLPDGTRLPARFNQTQTVGDVYEFIQRASPSTSGRAWVLSTTFPNKDHTDKDLVLGELPEFKRGGTAVVKWV